MDASCWVARKIRLSPASASSRACTLDSRPTTNGVIIYGKMTTSRMGIIGKRLVSVLSLLVTIGGRYLGSRRIEGKRLKEARMRAITRQGRTLASPLPESGQTQQVRSHSEY